MPAHYTPITLVEMGEFLTPLGFTLIQPAIAAECVYGKIVRKYPERVCIRIYTGIVGDISRPCGNDAIRVCAVKMGKDKLIKGIGKSRRVHRTQGWRKNLQSRIDSFEHAFAPYTTR